MSEGTGPTMKGPQLRQALEKMNIELEVGSTQIQQETRNKNRGRAKLPNDKAQENIDMNQPTSENTPSRSNDQMTHPEDRVVARLDRIGQGLERQESLASSARRAGEVAAGVVIGSLVVVGATELAKWAFAPAPKK